MRKTTNKPEVLRSHTCPIVYLQNFAHLCPKYEKKLFNYTDDTYKPPKQKDFCVYVHDKLANSRIELRSVISIGVKKKFYSDEIEQFVTDIENKVGREFKEIRKSTPITFFDTLPIYQFIMNQLVRTPKFQEKLRKDQIFLKEMDNKKFNESIFRLLSVKKPIKISKKSLQNLQSSMMTSNRLAEMFMWSKLTLVTNYTEIPFITSDCPVSYNYVDFVPSVLLSENKLEPSLLINKNTIFMFPLSPHHLIMIQDFDNKRKQPLLHYEVILDEKKIIILNEIVYKFAERFIILKDINEELIQTIRSECGNEINKEYQLLEQTYRSVL